MHVVRKDKRLILSGDLKTNLGSKINNAGDPRQNNWSEDLFSMHCQEKSL